MSSAVAAASIAASIAAADSASSSDPVHSDPVHSDLTRKDGSGPGRSDGVRTDRTERSHRTDRTEGAHQRRTARIAGALYLALFVLGPFVYFYVPGELFADDAATTAAQISANTGLFTAGMIAESVIVGIEIALAGLLWTLFRPVSEPLAFSSSLARIGEAFIQTVSVLLGGGVLIIVDRGGLSGLDPERRASVVGFLVELIELGVMVWGLLFGLHLVLLGVLVRRSALMPRWIGSLLIVAAVGYLAQSYGHLVDTDLDGLFESFVLVAIPGELAFAGFLLFRGVVSADRSTG